MRAFGAICACVWSISSLAWAEVELKNDGFKSGDPAGFQAGFAANEAAASRFVAPDAGRSLTRIQLLYGPDSSTPHMITLKAWDDSAGSDTPGVELYTADFTLMGSSSALAELTPAVTVAMPAQFRIGIVF